MFLEAVAKLTASQHGLVTTQQVLAVGASYEWLRWAVADGRLECVRRGVYRLVGSPTSQYVDIAASALAAGPGVGASHFAAGWLWNARDVAPALPDLIAFDGRHVRRSGLRVRRSQLDAATWMTRRHNIPTVVAPLMIVQIAAETNAELGIAIARDLRKRGLVSYRNVLECLDATGISTGAALRHYCERALRVEGHDDSPAASDLGVALLEAGVPAFVTQFQVVVEGRVRLLDFAWPEHRAGLEYLGAADHGLDQMDRDARRRTQLTAAGWRILDITSAMPHADVVRWVFQILNLAPRVQ
jgi:very-short-patch-repair endonuclease